MSRRFCLALDLKDDPVLVAEYRKYHEKIWPEITQSLKNSGIEDLEIYLLGTRMFMIMEVNQSCCAVAVQRFANRPNPTQVDYSDYRDAGKVKLPFQRTISNPPFPL